MSTEPEPAPASSDGESRERTAVWQGLRLGYLSSEVYGLVRLGALSSAAPRQTDPRRKTSRLSTSQGLPEAHIVQRLQLSLRMLLHHAELLGLYSGSIDSPLTVLSAAIKQFLSAPRTLPPPTAADVRYELDRWSVDAWARLAADNPLVARSFTYGASIGDTYYYMWQPKKGQEPGGQEETWQRLLRHDRLLREGQRIEGIRDYLPPGLADVLSASLLAWGVQPKLRDEYAELDAQGRPRLPLKTEQALHSQLKRQNRIWRQLILGERRPSDYLNRRELRRTRLIWSILFAVLVFLLATVVIGTAAAALGWLISFFNQNNAAYLAALRSDNETLEFTGLLVSMLPLVAGLAGFLWVAGRWSFEKLRYAYAAALNGIIVYRVKKRVIVPWDERLGDKA